MTVKIARYKGFELRAGAFEIPALNRFLSSLLIVKIGGSMSEDDSKLFTPRCDQEDGLFSTEAEAIEAAIEYGEAVIDGETPGQTLQDL